MFYCSIHIDMNKDIPPKVFERRGSSASLPRSFTEEIDRKRPVQTFLVDFELG